MPSIGTVTQAQDGSFRGQLKTLSIKADILIQPNERKTTDSQPDYRVLSSDAEIGAGWIRHSDASGRDYVSLALAASEFGPRRIYANLGRAAGADEDTLAIIWNPAD